MNWDHFSEGLALWSSEGEVNGVDFSISSNVWVDGKWNADLNSLLAFNVLFDRDVDDLDWALIEGLLVMKGEVATMLPWPVSIVENDKLFDNAGSWAGFKNTFRFLDYLGSEGVPRVTSIATEPIAA